MAAKYRVLIRQTILAEDTAATPRGDEEVFIALAEPPPVGSILRLVEVGGGITALSVRGVIEADTNGRGVIGRFVAIEELASERKVGTEHLAPGQASSLASRSDTADGDSSTT